VTNPIYFKRLKQSDYTSFYKSKRLAIEESKSIHNGAFKPHVDEIRGKGFMVYVEKEEDEKETIKQDNP